MNATKKRILFVDDEAHILDGIRRLLRRMRSDWEMDFVTSGADALRLLGESHYDVIVSDMRMPRMDGAELLREVRTHFPQMVRIVLSGYSDFEMALRTVSAAHQYLSKPCDGDTLINTIKRAVDLHDMLKDERLQSVISQIDNLPSPPDVYDALQKECASKTTGIPQVARIVARDPALTAKLLQLVNSSFFGVRRAITSIEEAVSMLGIELVKSLLAAVHVFKADEAMPPLFHDLWHHCIDTGRYARAIQECEDSGRKNVELAFTAGLLHDTGKLILWRGMEDRYAPLVHEADEDDVKLTALEEDALGTNHGRIGAYLLGLWGLPDAIVEAVAYHHDPQHLNVDGFCTTTAVHVGDALSICERSPQASPPLSNDHLQRIGALDRLDVWRDSCAKLKEEGMAA